MDDPVKQSTEERTPFYLSTKIVSAGVWLVMVVAAAAFYTAPFGSFSWYEFWRILLLLGFLFAYQLVTALAVGNAFDGAGSRWDRGVFAGLGVLSFGVMLLDLPVIRIGLELPLGMMMIMTPLCCIGCGSYLLARQHYLSGAVICWSSLVSWPVPFLGYVFIGIHC